MTRRGWIMLYARLALASAFLSGIADRLGLWGKDVGYGGWEGFVKYTAQVNSFMPPATIPALAWGASLAELTLALALIIGYRLRLTALASAVLLAIFGTAMAISLGPKSPLDYSVFSASAGALLLANYARHERGLSA